MGKKGLDTISTTFYYLGFSYYYCFRSLETNYCTFVDLENDFVPLIGGGEGALEDFLTYAFFGDE